MGVHQTPSLLPFSCSFRVPGETEMWRGATEFYSQKAHLTMFSLAVYFVCSCKKTKNKHSLSTDEFCFSEALCFQKIVLKEGSLEAVV